MGLATRCSSCGTVFRVVQDQLKVSEGWVRCGRCSEVFNALDTLFDLDQPAAETPPIPADTARPDATEAAVDALPAEAAESTAPEIGIATVPLPGPPQREAVASFEATNEAAGTEPAAASDTDTPPAFVRQADRAARWRRPGVRAALALAALALLALLLLQTALHYRDLVAVQWPAARPLLQSLCGVAGCTIEPPRRIDALAVDSSGLVRIEGSTLYRMTLVLRNRGASERLMPSVDLALTDAQGQLMARRVLGAAELGVTQRSIAPGSEVSMQAMLNAGERRVAGYTIEIFYP